MKNNDFHNRISRLNDGELLELAKKYLANEKSDSDFSARRANAIYDECKKRNISLFNRAMSSAYAPYHPFNQDGYARVKDVKYFSSLTLSELQALTAQFPDSNIKEFIAECGIIKKGSFFGTVDGVSMINAKLFNGDIIICNSAEEIRDGKIVVAEVENQLFIKRFRLIDGEPHLFPENPDYSPVKLTDEFEYRLIGCAQPFAKKSGVEGKRLARNKDKHIMAITLLSSVRSYMFIEREQIKFQKRRSRDIKIPGIPNIFLLNTDIKS